MPSLSKTVSKKVSKNPLLRQNSDKQCVVCIHAEGMMDKKNHPRPCRIYNLIIITILFSTCVICACVYAATSVIQKNVLAEVMERQEKLQRQTSDATNSYGDPTGGISRVSKRSENRRRHRRRRDQICRNNDQNQKSTLHMHITPSEQISYDDPMVSGHFLVWSEGDHRRMANFAYDRNPNVDSPDDVIGVKITHGGMYEIYSQVIIKGLRVERYPYYCAQKIVLIRGGREHKVLLTSFLTQNEYYLNGIRKPAVDTVFQYGVFYLRRDDKVRVSACTNVEYSHLDDREAFYFGIAQR